MTPGLKQSVEGGRMTVSLHIGAVSSGLVFSKENTNQDMESCNKQELTEAIRKEHLAVRNRNI